MGTTYTAKVTVNCIKEHDCVGCVCKFRYHMIREIQGSGGSEAAARGNAQDLAVKSLENDVDQHACPACGMMQPDMIAEVRSGRYTTGMWLGPVIMLVGFFLALIQVTTIATSGYVVLAGALVSLAFFFYGFSFSPNKDMMSARMESLQKIDAGQLAVEGELTSTQAMDDFSGLTAGHMLGIGLTGAAVVAAVSPMLLTILGGWSMNDTYPAVAGPGDTTCVYFDKKIKSLKGYWKGTVTVSGTTSDGAVQGLTGTTKNSKWGNTISGKNLSNETHSMWVNLKLPKDEKLVGKKLKLQLNVQAMFPYEVGNRFDIQGQKYSYTTEMYISSGGSGALYYQAWLYGQIAAMVLVVIAGWVLLGASKTLSQRANPPTIYTVE